MKKLIWLTLAMSVTAHAEFWDGNKLLSRLQSTGFDYGTGLGYVMGVSDSLQGATSCPPANVTLGQIADMVKQHLESVPSTRHLSADQHIYYVLKKTWPCASSKPSGRNNT